VEDFYYARGCLRLLAALKPHLDLSCQSITEKHLGKISLTRTSTMQTSFATSTIPSCLGRIGHSAGNLAPDGAVIKAAAAEPALLRHTGPAIVFDSFDEMNARIDDPSLNVDAASVLVLRNAGPKGAPGSLNGATCRFPKSC